ncbi:MAG: IS1595 family transposase [Flavisolibacter sp.]
MAFKNLTQLFDYFKDEATCRGYLEQQRWNGAPECPFCSCTKVYRTKRGFKCADKFCAKAFTVTVGTIYENTKIGLRTWFAAIYLCTSSKKGISSLQLHRQLGITQKTAWFVLHRIREMLKDKAPHMLKNVVEIDESFVGGKNKNRHADKKVQSTQGRSWKDKTPVLGILERHGNVRVVVTPDTKLTTLYPIMVDNISKGSIMVSDEWYHQKTFNPDYAHVIINHRDGEYVRGAFHTNTIEGFWSIFKRGIYGIYHQVSPKHLQRYCDEFAARYNTRKILDNERFEASIKNSAGRLKYNQLIGK